MPQTKPIRVLLIDDHAVVRSGLRMLVESRSGLKVAGEAANRAEALAIAKSEQPDVILLDLDMNNDNGLHFLPQLLAVAGNARVLILTGVRDPDRSEEHTSELQSRLHLVCRLLLEKKK